MTIRGSEAHMEPKRACGHDDCCTSTGICDSLTFGRGKLDDLGYWEIPCAPCARKFEKKHPEFGTCWPFPEEAAGE